MKRKFINLLIVLMMICIGTVSVNAEPAHMLEINVNFNENHTFSNLSAKLDETTTEGVTLSWVNVQVQEKAAPIFTLYEGDFSDTSNVFLRVQYSNVNDYGVEGVAYKINGRNGFFKDKSNGNLNDWISFNDLSNNGPESGPRLNVNFDQNGNLVIANEGNLVLGGYSSGTVEMQSESNQNDKYTFDSSKFQFISNSNDGPERIVVSTDGVNFAPGTYTIKIKATGKGDLTIGGFPIGGPGPGPQVDDRFEAFQDASGNIVIRPKEGVTNVPDLGAYVVTNDLSSFNQDSNGNYNWNYIESVVGNNCISFQSSTYGDLVYNYKNKNNDVFERIHYNSQDNSLIIDYKWAIFNLDQGTYRVDIIANGNAFSVGDVDINGSYAYATDLDGSNELRYGFYRDKNGTLTTSGWGDNHIMSNERTSAVLLFGVATFANNNNGTDANAIPGQEFFDAITITDVSLVLDPVLEGKVSTTSVTTGKLAEMDAKKITVNFEEGIHGVGYVLVKFKIGESSDIHYAYIKLMFDAAQGMEFVLDMQGKTGTEIIDELNNTFTSLNSLTTKFPQITPATNPNDMADVTIVIKNVPDEVIEGNIVWNVSAPNGYQMDHNNYEIIGNGLKINGSFTNNGNTGVFINSFIFDNLSGNDGEQIAINPNVGDISVQNCEINGYTYGIKTHKNGSNRTGFIEYIDNCVFNNCGTAVSLENIENFTGIRYTGWIKENIFKNCDTALEILDLMLATNDLNAMYSHSFDVEYNYFLNNNLDIHIKKSSHDEVEDEYYYFPNNYFGSSATQITNKNYRTASIVKDEHVIICTSPALMFPEVENKIGQIGIDNQAITAMKKGVEYKINTRSKFKGAIAIAFDPSTGLPYGTATLNNFGIKNY